MAAYAEGVPKVKRLAASFYVGTNTVHATEEDANDESLKVGLAARIKRRGVPSPAVPGFKCIRRCSVGGAAALVDGAASVMVVNSVTARRIMTRLQPDLSEFDSVARISWHVLGERSAFHG